MQMGFNARVLSTVLKTVVWLSLMSNFFTVSNGFGNDISCLKSIKKSLEDPYNYLGTSWNFHNQSEGFICNFTGIECWRNEENRVLNIRLSGMGLKGEFPRGIVNCSALTGLNLSNNNLFGTIPSNMSSLIRFVTSLDLSGNSFSGEIPRDIANLSYLNLLKLDNNRLTGKIPHELGLLDRIKVFSVANNLLSGSVPFFFDATTQRYANNKGLCGGPLESCKARKNDGVAIFLGGFVEGWSVSTVLVFALSLFCLPINNPLLKEIVSSRKNKRTQEISKLEKLVTRISFTELMNVTDNFGEDSIIGFGKTGTMYKAVLPNGWFLAIKRFYNSRYSEGQFVAEVLTLGRLRHTNLVPLIGFCYEREDRVDRLLIYKYISNGNLYDWLHRPEYDLNIMKWPVRVKISVGLARGLAWLHHHNKRFRVFHHNISSKCILLDRNFEPKISNFGDAMFMNLMNGELLELGFDKKDVYSFGVVLIELVTGKETINASANSDRNPFSLRDAVDKSLIGLGFDGEIFEFLSIACKCVQSLPEQRPTMLQVYQTMRATGKKHGIVDDY
ncbi:putative leucine-rich repeat receptor-like protein kinase [Camellia lanceoleosa]|uniref:Leucine-rich repeat receptor-like protein kinase n=1 Tax=Camellia lanceoleosa TaxID=1840588 RepID=A0ACC0GTK9_9ERIC|nr:putative leucine-rich repeat receptor-like protein kinase [Camellia lanceoleosa]